MSALFDFFEERLADHIVGNSAYTVPWHFTLSGSADGEYKISIASENTSETTFSTGTVSGKNEDQILDNLESSIDGGSHPVDAHRYVDQNSNETLMIEGSGSSEKDWTISGWSTSGGASNWDVVEQRVWGALYLSDPQDDDSGLEVLDARNNNGYAREKIAFDAATGQGLIDNTNDVEWGPAGSNGWNDGGGKKVSHFAIRDAHSSKSGDFKDTSTPPDKADDNPLIHGALSSSKDVTNNDSVVFRAGDLDITFD